MFYPSDEFMETLDSLAINQVSENWYILTFKEDAAFFGTSMDIVIGKFLHWHDLQSDTIH